MTLQGAFLEALRQIMDDVQNDWKVLGFAIQVVVVPEEGGTSNTIATHVIHVDNHHREADFLTDCRDALNERIADLTKGEALH